MAAVWNDSLSAAYGTRILSIPYSGATQVSYIADSYSVTRPTTLMTRTDNANEPNAQVFISDFVTGQANLQLAAATTAVPTIGQVFYGTNVGSLAPDKMCLTEVGEVEAKADFRTCSISFRKLVNL